jgi:hypothetical protein
MTAAQQAAALHVLAAALDKSWTSTPRPVLLGPDTHSFHDGNVKANGATLQYLQDYVTATAGILGAGAYLSGFAQWDRFYRSQIPL